MKNQQNFSVKFWGVRGSYPVAGESTIRYGGNTPCVEVRAGNHVIILDAGTGIIKLGQQLAREFGAERQPVNVHLFFSHLHHDHTQGLPFFSPAYMPTSNINFFLPNIYDVDPDKILENVMAPPNFPVPFYRLGAEKKLFALAETQVVILGETQSDVLVQSATAPYDSSENVVIRMLRSYGHPQGVMAYRIEWAGKALIYATDTEGYVNGDRRMVNFARDADLLIHDAQYTEDHYVGKLAGVPVTQGYGHSTAEMACETARSAKVGQLILFHHDPNYDDVTIAKIENRARVQFSNTLAAREGQQILLQRQQIPTAIRDVIAEFRMTGQAVGLDGDWASI